MGNADAIFAGSGQCLSGPYGTTLPEEIDEMTALDGALIDLGIVSEDGLEHAFGVDKSVIKDWQGRPVRTVSTATEITFKLTFLETNKAVVERYYGHDVEAAGTGSKVTLDQPSDAAYTMVIPVEDESTGKTRVYVLPRVEVFEREDQTVKPDETGYGLTFQALYDPVADCAGWILYEDDLTSA